MSSSGVLITELDFKSSSDGFKTGGAPGSSQSQKRASIVSKTSPPKTVEEATFEFNPTAYSRLPTTVDFPVVVSNAIKGMTFANQSGRDKWKNYFLSDPSRHIIQDLFWWIFCSVFKKGTYAGAEDHLLQRVAGNYVRLFYIVSKSYKDQFFSRFYDTLAQVVFQAFYVAYPKSRSQFDDSFKMKLLETFSRLTTGILPSGLSHDHWPNTYESSQLKRGGNIASLGSAGGVSSQLQSDSRKALKTKSSDIRCGIKFVRRTCVLSNSPLIKRYLNKPGEEESPHMSFKILLTDNPDRPIVSDDFGPTSSRAAKRLEAAGERQAFLQQSQNRRKQIFETYEKARDKALRDIHTIRREKAYDQEAIQSRETTIMAGDVHEFSNYLVSRTAS